MATRIRQGYCTNVLYKSHDLLPILRAGEAGKREAGTNAAIIAVPGVAGHICYGGYLDLAPGTYHVTLGLDLDAPLRRTIDKSDLGLEVVSGPYLLRYRGVEPQDLAHGSISLKFTVTRQLTSELTCLAVEFRLRSAGRTNVAIRSASLTETEDGEESDSSSFDWLPLLSLGPAGMRGQAPPGAVVSSQSCKASVIHAVRGIDGAVAYGPYFALLPGRYQAIFELYFIDAPDDAAIRADVVTDSGNRFLAEERIVPASRSSARRLLGRSGSGFGTIRVALGLIVEAFRKPVTVYGGDNYRVISGTWAKKAVKFRLGFVIPKEALAAPDHMPVEFRVRSCGKASFYIASLRVVPAEPMTIES